MNLSNSLNAHFPLLKQAVNAPFSRLIIFLLLCLVGFNLPIANAIPTIGNWVFPDRDYRMPISVAANGYARTDKIAELDVDFGVRLTALGAVGTFDEDSIRVVEVDVSGSSLDTDVPFQFDNGSSVDEPAGTLVFVMVGNTAVSATRYYHIYFDTTSTFSAPTIPADRVVVVKDNQEYRGQSSFVIETLDSDNTTVNATYYYHKLGGGFASIKDRQDKDWISYQQGSGTKSGGEYRGIPNLGKVFHPGYSNNSGNNQGSNSTITDDGSLKVTIRSVSKDGEWEVEWGIYPTYIQMTVIDHPNDEKYWMLYEGTPGGQLDYSSNPRDTMMMSDGSEINVNQTHNADFDPDWVYFADGTIDRSIFVAHSPNDNIIDSYRHQDDFSGNGDADAMTVFGFGRNRLTGTTKYLEADGATLTVGFIDDRDYSDNKPVINAAYRALTITIGNEVPTLDANSGFTVDEGETAVFTSTNLDASDPEGGEITYEIGSGPANGTLFRNDTPLSDSDTFTQTDINGGIISYDHDGSETSSDSFTFTIADDLNTSAVKSFAIGITAVNDPPTATSDNEQLTAGGSTTINLVANDDDVDDSTLFVTSLTQPTHGMVVNNGNGTVTYSIGFDYEGNDTFTYRATDGELSSATTTVTITVDPALNIYIPLVIK